MPDNDGAAPLDETEVAQLFSGLDGLPLALAVSGGADSMALMLLVARWLSRGEVRIADRQGRQSEIGARPGDSRTCLTAASMDERPPWLFGIESVLQIEQTGGHPPVVILTVDHGLRPESASEAHFVAEAAANLGFPCWILKWEGSKPSSGVQAAARAARRTLLATAILAEARHISALSGLHHGLPRPRRRLVMAHHQEDQAETVLMRLARGSGLEGLGGMRPRDRIAFAANSDQPAPVSIDLHRPLLDIPKARLVATLRSAGLAWIEDPSNDDPRFERVRVRRALAALDDIGLTPARIALSARRLRDADAALNQLWQAQDPANCAQDRIGAAWADVLLDTPRFSAPQVLIRTLRWLLAIYGGRSEPAELAQLEELQRICSNDRHRLASGGVTLAGCKFEFHGEHGRVLRVYREEGAVGLPTVPIGPGQATGWDGGRFWVTAPPDGPAGAEVRALGTAGWTAIKREVASLGDLRLPAAAMATLPVVIQGARLISACGVDFMLRNLVPALPEEQANEWDTAFGTLQSGYVANFHGGVLPRW